MIFLALKKKNENKEKKGLKVELTDRYKKKKSKQNRGPLLNIGGKYAKYAIGATSIHCQMIKLQTCQKDKNCHN